MTYIVGCVQKSVEESKATPKTNNRENTETKELTLVVNNGTKSNVVLFSDTTNNKKQTLYEDHIEPENDPQMYSIYVNKCLHTAV